MKDLMNIMGKAREMQAKMEEMQADLAAAEITGEAGGGLVKVTLTGKNEMRAIAIDPSLFKEDDVEVLEDLIIAAFNDARGRIEALVAEKTQALTAGMPLPPGFKMPF